MLIVLLYPHFFLIAEYTATLLSSHFFFTFFIIQIFTDFYSIAWSFVTKITFPSNSVGFTIIPSLTDSLTDSPPSVPVFRVHNRPIFSVAPFERLSALNVLSAMGLGFLLALLIFIDQNIVVSLTNAPENRWVSLPRHTSRTLCHRNTRFLHREKSWLCVNQGSSSFKVSIFLFERSIVMPRSASPVMKWGRLFAIFLGCVTALLLATHIYF